MIKIEGIISPADNKVVILENGGLTGEWYFDISGHEEELILKDWIDTMNEVELLLTALAENFEVNRIHVTITCREFFDKFDIGYSKTFSALDAISNVKSFVSRHEVNYNLGFMIKITCNGKVFFDEFSEFYDNLFTIDVERANKIGVTIATNNFSFLPHNPVMKSRQYEIWKHNAPKLAKALEKFTKSTRLDLLTDKGAYFKNGMISENVFFLQNTAITGVDDPNWDEFYIPFELLEENKDGKF